MKGLAWALMPRYGDHAALYAVAGANFLIRLSFDDDWLMTECSDVAHADRAVLFLIGSMAEAGAVISAGPVEFELPAHDVPMASDQIIGRAAERALAVVRR